MRTLYKQREPAEDMQREPAEDMQREPAEDTARDRMRIESDRG
jgi:hypothetical protein